MTDTPPPDRRPDSPPDTALDIHNRERQKQAARDERRERLAAALRDNLKRRKAQARMRADGGGSAGDAESNP